jgi:hypothetical protein
LKELVADRVPEGIVDVLEAIQIKKQDRDLSRVAGSQGDRLADPVVQEHPIRQAGEKVVLGRMDHFERHGAGRTDRSAQLLDLSRQMLFGLIANRDVANRRGDEDALGTLERAEHDLDREFAAILAPSDELDPSADLLSQSVGSGPQVVGDQSRGETLRDDVGDRLAEELVTAIAELLLGPDVEQDDLALLVDDDHGVRGRLEKPAVAALRVPRPRTGGASADGEVDRVGQHSSSACVLALLPDAGEAASLIASGSKHLPSNTVAARVGAIESSSNRVVSNDEPQAQR